MFLSDFDYHLPNELIAQKPIKPRHNSKLMVLDRQTQTIKHHYFYELPQILDEKYVLVLNNSKVLPARLYGQKITGGKVKILLTKKVSRQIWEVLSQPGLKAGQKVLFHKNKKILLWAEVLQASNTEGITKLRFFWQKTSFNKILQKLGCPPLPPYISLKDKNNPSLVKEYLKSYQTVYAQKLGSIAAPTAGLHFSQALLEALKKKNISQFFLTLHVGPGTFLPIKEKQIEKHHMHEEFFLINKKTLKNLKISKLKGKKIVAVGTTSCRVLETLALNFKNVFDIKPQSIQKSTNLYIYPPFNFQLTDVLLTNFHLPRSTLLLLVTAFVSYPNSKEKFKTFKSSFLGKAYQAAIKEKYRFYSFGDAMLIF